MFKSYFFLYLFFISIPIYGMKESEERSGKRSKSELVTLISSDGQQFTIDLALAQVSALLVTIRAHDMPIKVPVDAKTLSLVINALRHIVIITAGKSLPKKYVHDVLGFALRSLFDELSESELLKLLQASNDLDVPFLSAVINKYIKVALKTRVTLISNDEKNYMLPSAIAKLSLTVQRMIEEFGTNNPITFEAISGKTLSLIVKSLKTLYATKDNQQQLELGLQALFTAETNDDIINLFYAANYLEIPLLFDGIVNCLTSRLIENSSTHDLSVYTKKLMGLPKELRKLVSERLERSLQPMLINLFFRQLKILKAHSAPLLAVSFSCHGNYALTGSKDTTAILWNLENGATQKFQRHANWIVSTAFIGDGKEILTVSLDGIVCFWNTDTHDLIREIKLDVESIRSATISNSCKYVLIATWNSKVLLCNLVTGKVVKELIGHTDHIEAGTFSADDTKILTGSCDAKAILWDLTQDGKVIKPHKIFEGHRSAIIGVAICKDSNCALTAALDCSLRFWDLATGKHIKQLSGLNIKHVSFSADGHYALIHKAYDRLILWDLKNETILAESLPSDAEINSAAFNSQGNILLGLSDGTVRLYGITDNYKLSIAELVLILKLWQSSSEKTMLDSAYFTTVFNSMCPRMKAILKERYNSRQTL